MTTDKPKNGRPSFAIIVAIIMAIIAAGGLGFTIGVKTADQSSAEIKGLKDQIVVQNEKIGTLSSEVTSLRVQVGKLETANSMMAAQLIGYKVTKP